jgi:hypothetical protein
MMAIDKRLSFLREKFDSFYSILYATTISVDDGRRVDGIADAVALSEATEELWAGILAATRYLIQQHGTSMTKYPPEIKLQETDSPDGPWEDIPPERVTITKIPIRGEALLIAALNKVGFIVAHSPDSKGNRWHRDDIISTDDLARLDAVNKLLAKAAEGGAAQEPAQRKAGLIETGSAHESQVDIAKLESETPALDTDSTDWLSNKVAAQRLSPSTKILSTRTLANRRAIGQKAGDGLFGIDVNGCIWRKLNTNAHPFYYAPSHKSLQDT